MGKKAFINFRRTVRDFQWILKLGESLKKFNGSELGDGSPDIMRTTFSRNEVP